MIKYYTIIVFCSTFNGEHKTTYDSLDQAGVERVQRFYEKVDTTDRRNYCLTLDAIKEKAAK
jgi:hypothetical protein